MKKLFALPLAALAVLGLASCGDKTPKDPTDDFDQNQNQIKPDIQVFIVGSHWNSWTPDYDKISKADPSCLFTLDTNSSGLNTKYTYTATVTQEMIDVWCGWKFVSTSGWNTQWGMEDVDFSKCNKDFLEKIVGDKNNDGKFDVEDKYAGFQKGTSDRSNIEATVPGTFVIEYYPYNFTSETKTTANGDISYTCKFAVQFTPAA